MTPGDAVHGVRLGVDATAHVLTLPRATIRAVSDSDESEPLNAGLVRETLDNVMALAGALDVRVRHDLAHGRYPWPAHGQPPTLARDLDTPRRL